MEMTPNKFLSRTNYKGSFESAVNAGNSFKNMN